VLIAVVFDGAWNVGVAASYTHKAVQELAVYRQHVNGHVMHVRRSTFSVPGVQEITDALRDEWRKGDRHELP